MLNDDGNLNHMSRIVCIPRMQLVDAASARASEFTEMTRTFSHKSAPALPRRQLFNPEFEELMTLKQPVRSCFADEKHA
jgi:hypothetical protein